MTGSRTARAILRAGHMGQRKYALENLAEQYSESPWPGAAVVPEVWLEKDALAGPVYDTTYRYYVPLRVQRGYASLSALYKAAKDIDARFRRYGSRTHVYYLRDLDPSGADAARAAEQTIADMLSQMESPAIAAAEFEILGVTPEQVAKWKLPSRPNKATDSRTAKFEHQQSVDRRPRKAWPSGEVASAAARPNK